MVLEVLRLETSHFIQEFNEKMIGLWMGIQIRKYALGGAEAVNSKFRNVI